MTWSMMGLLVMKDKVEKGPWVPKELPPYRQARLVPGDMAAAPPDADPYAYLIKEKVVRLIRQAPELESIDTYLWQTDKPHYQ